eukprot:90260_1
MNSIKIIDSLLCIFDKRFEGLTPELSVSDDKAIITHTDNKDYRRLFNLIIQKSNNTFKETCDNIAGFIVAMNRTTIINVPYSLIKAYKTVLSFSLELNQYSWKELDQIKNQLAIHHKEMQKKKQLLNKESRQFDMMNEWKQNPIIMAAPTVDDDFWNKILSKYRLTDRFEPIPQRNIDLTFGFIRECESKEFEIPNDIKQTCLLFYNLNEDAFDTYTIKYIPEWYYITDNVAKSLLDRQDTNIYLDNIAKCGLHCWKFRYYQDDDDDDSSMVGIFDLNYPVFRTGPRGGFDHNYNYELYNEDDDDDDDADDHYICTGYALYSNGMITNPSDPDEEGAWMTDGYKHGDVIRMRLDLNASFALAFKINNGEWRNAFTDIKRGEYVAAVYLLSKCGFELLSYQYTE